MPSSQSELSVCNLSLLSIGSRAQISSVNPSDGSPPANACNTLYNFVFEQLARTARWGCLKKQVNLSLLQAAQGTPENPQGTTLPLPQQPWLYGYLYPSDCLFVRAILCPIGTSSGSGTSQTSIANNTTSYLPDQYQIPYEIASSQDSNGNPLQVILTNQEAAVGNYTVNIPNPSSWDSLFTSAYVASLAAYLVPALSLQPQLMQMQIQIAERLIGQARAQDGNESTWQQNRTPDWIRARRGGRGWCGGGLRGFNGYGMIWPG